MDNVPEFKEEVGEVVFVSFTHTEIVFQHEFREQRYSRTERGRVPAADFIRTLKHNNVSLRSVFWTMGGDKGQSFYLFNRRIVTLDGPGRRW